MRIDKQWTILLHARLCMELEAWEACLENIRLELHERMDQKEHDKADQYELAVRNEVVEAEKSGKSGKAYSLKNLKMYGRFLKDLEFKFGMSLPDKPSEGDAALL